MRRMTGMALAVLLAVPGLAFGQSNPITGQGSAQIHGQRPDMGQDLHNAPGSTPSAQNQPTTPRTRDTGNRNSAPRNQLSRQQVQQQQARRERQNREQAAAGHAARTQRTGQAGAPGRTTDSMAAQEARMAEARRRQMEAEERAARAFPGVR